jgi:hypothetical protein
MSGGIRNGLNDMVMRVTSDPDGFVTAPRGTLAIDTSTGVQWTNRSGGTRWDPSYIPPLWGYSNFFDFDDARFTAAGIAGGTTSEAVPPAGRIGIRTVGATAAGVDGAVVRTSAVGAVLLGAGRYVVRGGASLGALSDGTDRVVLRIGGGDATTFADNTDGVYLEYDLATYSDHNFRLCARSNGTSTKVDTGIAPVAGTYFNFEIRVNALGTLVTAEIDGVASANSVSSNIPSGAGRGFAPIHALWLKSLGSSLKTASLDWMSYYQVFSTARGL